MKKILFPIVLSMILFAIISITNAQVQNLVLPGPNPQQKIIECQNFSQHCNTKELLHTGKAIQEKWGTITLGASTWDPITGSPLDTSGSPFGFEVQKSVNAFGFVAPSANIYDSLTLDYLAYAGFNNPQDQDSQGANPVTSLLCATAKGSVKPCSAEKFATLNYITIDPKQAPVTQPSVVLFANPSSTNNKTTLTWSSTNAHVCEALTGDGFATENASRETSGSVEITVTENMRYTIACYNDMTGEYSIASTNVTKLAAPPPPGNGNNGAMFVVADCIYGPNMPNCLIHETRQQACNAGLTTNYDYDKNDYMNLTVGDKLYLAGTKNPLRIPWFQNEPGKLPVWVAAKGVGPNQTKKVFRIENLRVEGPNGWGDEYTQIVEVGADCS